MRTIDAGVTMMLLAGLAGAGCGNDEPVQPDDPDSGVVDDPDAADPEPDAGPEPEPCEPTALRTDLTWFGDNRATLQAWITANGCASPGFDAEAPPVAMFDWDNTVIKNDIGDAITFWMISHAKVLQPPGQDWGNTSRYMTAGAKAALTAACGITVAAGQPLPTDTDTDCADEMLSIYIEGVTTAAGGALPAFSGWNYRRMEPTYAWTAQLLAGYTPAEIRAFTAMTIADHLAAAEGAVQTVGSRTTLNAYLRLYPQQLDLIATLHSNGFDVRVITASPQYVVEAFAPMAGISADKVSGIRSVLDSAGRLTYDFVGCGPVADGDNSMIPYIEGKRCWVNKSVYGDVTAAAMNQRPVGMRQVFGAGDSDTDIEFLKDSSLKLVLNRGKKELMCNGYHSANDSWLVNPMFIAPRVMQAAPYACSTSACKNSSGANVACFDELSNPIPDQVDSVY